MIAEIKQSLSLINFQLFLFSMVLFFAGYTLAPWAYYKDIKFLLAYPKWLAKKLDKLASRHWHFATLFMFILGVNTFSLFIDLLSGLAPLLPVVFAVWTGFNVGVITYHTLVGKFYFASLLNPVALFELPAAFIAFTLALQYNCVLIGCRWLGDIPQNFSVYLKAFFWIVIPLLIIAGLIETFAIKFAQRIEEAEEEKDKTKDDL
ncbi:stage II sporulation protein M [Caldithrix abyssi]